MKRVMIYFFSLMVIAGLSSFTGKNETKNHDNNFQSSFRLITGVVTDCYFHHPLSGVTVQVVGTSIGTITNALGQYSLYAPTGVHQLKFSLIGYEDKIAYIYGTGNGVVNVCMRPAVENIFTVSE